MASHPLVVPVLDLLRRPGARKDLVTSVVLDPIVLTGAAVPDGAEVDISLTLEVQGEQLMVSGHVEAPWQGECRRCLDPTEGTVTATIQEVFERDPIDGETWPLAIDRVDLEPVVHEAVLLALPLAPLCAPDCPGPDPERFPALVEGETLDADDVAATDVDGPDAIPLDPRWAALDQLHFD